LLRGLAISLDEDISDPRKKVLYETMNKDPYFFGLSNQHLFRLVHHPQTNTLTFHIDSLLHHSLSKLLSQLNELTKVDTFPPVPLEDFKIHDPLQLPIPKLPIFDYDQAKLVEGDAEYAETVI
jgi:hypothetical protein